MRLSGSIDALRPGISIKFLRSKRMSGNILGLYSLIPLNNYNFFSVPLTNEMIIPQGLTLTPGLKKFAERICQSGYCNSKVGLSNLCAFDQNGHDDQGAIEFPFFLILEPGKTMTMEATKPASMLEFLDRLKAAVPIGSQVYKMRALTSPNDTVGLDLGIFETTDECITSLYGDKTLFFKHQDLAEDVALRPEWADALHQGCSCNPSPDPDPYDLHVF